MLTSYCSLQDGTIGEDLVVKPVPSTVEERLRDSREQQRLWRENQQPRIHSDRNASRAIRKEEDQELFVDYAFLGKRTDKILCLDEMEEALLP
jgi:hypothetical protein